MRWAMVTCAALTLAACGADGEPEPPTRDATITLSDAGASGTAQFGVSQGPATVTLGLGL